MTPEEVHAQESVELEAVADQLVDQIDSMVRSTVDTFDGLFSRRPHLRPCLIAVIGKRLILLGASFIGIAAGVQYDDVKPHIEQILKGLQDTIQKRRDAIAKKNQNQLESN